MKKLFVLLLTLISLNAVADGFKIVGQVNMISTRNIENGANYELLKTGTDNSKKTLKDIRGENIDDAINNAVSNVPGGEFLKNVKIYSDGKYFAVLGDVWGQPQFANVEGFRIGDQVLIKNSLVSKTLGKDKFLKGKVTGFKDKKTALVQLENGEIKEVAYTDLSKTE